MAGNRGLQGPDGTGLRVLVVDDRAVVRRALEMALEGTGLEVVGQADRSTARAAVDDLRPDVVVGDPALLGAPDRPGRPEGTARMPAPEGPEDAGRGRRETAGHRLTRREIEILQVLSEGVNARDMAQRLFVSPKTVTNHLTTIYAKLGVKGRAQAIVRSAQMGLIQIHEVDIPDKEG